MKGRITDDTLGKRVSNAVAMAVRLSDSILVKFSRSDSNGYFRMEKLPVDTYQVVFTHPDFGDKTFIIMANKNDSVVDFKNVAMPIKSIQIAEVTIYGFASPVYFKGDTLIYTADSFKVKPNAVVEDLLKKLPGIQVDKNGKIFAQGQQVDKLLVDGDEFFGSDPTIATKNLPASGVESVQVYDKKVENASDESKETEKVMNLQLKEDAKKGYFGKASGAGDFDKFFEEQLLVNRFRGRQKISVFSLGSNTRNSEFDWSDIYEYGIYDFDDFQYMEETDSYYSSNSSYSSGIPRTFKNGFFYTDHLFKDTKLDLNYSNTISDLTTRNESNSQYFFPDTTYRTSRNSNEDKKAESNSLNFGISQKIDSVTNFYIGSRIKYDQGDRNYDEIDRFISSDGQLQRETDVNNTSKFTKYDIKNKFSFDRDFKKKKRNLFIEYRFNIFSNSSNTLLNSVNTYDSIPANDGIRQEKKAETEKSEHYASIAYTEPFTKKIRAEFKAEYTSTEGLQDRKTFDFYNGSYDLLNDSLTNNYRNDRQISRGGINLIYDTKKNYFSFGTRYRQVISKSNNIETGSSISQTVGSLLPYARYRYSFSDNQRIWFNYNSSSKQPELNQLQPLKDNSDPNSEYIGNPDLLPAYYQTFSSNFNSFKAVTGNSVWSSLKFTTINNNFSTSVYYDSTGKSITQPININGNYNGNFNFYYTLNFFSKDLVLTPNISSVYNNRSSLINGMTNETKSLSLNGGLGTTLHADSSNLEININYNMGRTVSSSTIGSFSNTSFSNANLSASASYTIAKKWVIASDIMYTYQTLQAKDEYLDYYIWGASFSRKFFKKENLLISVVAYDLLDQNMEAGQSVNDNIITYSTTNSIGRYILLKAEYKFNSNKGNEEAE